MSKNYQYNFEKKQNWSSWKAKSSELKFYTTHKQHWYIEKVTLNFDWSVKKNNLLTYECKTESMEKLTAEFDWTAKIEIGYHAQVYLKFEKLLWRILHFIDEYGKLQVQRIN